MPAGMPQGGTPNGMYPSNNRPKTELPSVSPRGVGGSAAGGGLTGSGPSSGPTPGGPGGTAGISSFQHSPVPGNPTPPLTPNGPSNCLTAPFASPVSEHGSTSSDTKPNYSLAAKEEVRLTFPVQEGVLLHPFRLEHNLAVSNHVFHLKPQVSIN